MFIVILFITMNKLKSKCLLIIDHISIDFVTFNQRNWAIRKMIKLKVMNQFG